MNLFGWFRKPEPLKELSDEEIVVGKWAIKRKDIKCTIYEVFDQIVQVTENTVTVQDPFCGVKIKVLKNDFKKEWVIL